MKRLTTPLSILLLLEMLIGAALSTDTVQALLIDSASVPANTFAAVDCFPADTGFLDPTGEAADTGGNGDGFELNPTNAFADGGGYASNIDGAGDRHRFYNYGLSIDSTCVINGIEVRLDWYLNDNGGTNSMSVELSWDGGTSWTAAKTDTTETSTEHTAILGGVSDTWGRTWVLSEFSDANFRVRLTSNASKSGQDFFLDWVPVNVHYGPP